MIETINNNRIDFKNIIKKLPFLMMPIFCIIHMGMYVNFTIGDKVMSLSFVNAVYSSLYIAALYLWAFFANEKNLTRIAAAVMAALSCICFFISYPDLGVSFNDILSTGAAVLSLIYVMENAIYLVEIIREYDKYITITIWAFIVFSVILFLFFSSQVTSWGYENYFGGILSGAKSEKYFFGHKYASVCSHVMILIWLKLSSKPAKPIIYWGVMMLCYLVCFWTGARVYTLANLGILYGAIYCFRKSNMDFLIKCTAVTLVATVVFFISSMSQKNEIIIKVIEMEIENAQETPDAMVWINGLGNGRVSMWSNSIKSYMELPLQNKLFGSGNKYMYDNNNHLSSHTDFINILHFHGIIGFAIYLLVFIGGTIYFWQKNKLPIILFICFIGVWFFLAVLNGYASYTANMMSLPYILPMAILAKKQVAEEVNL